MAGYVAGEPITSPKAGMILIGQSGVVSVVITAATNGSATATFPAPFAATPRITCQVVTGASAALKSTIQVTVLSATSATIRVDLAASNTVTVPVHWIAVEG